MAACFARAGSAAALPPGSRPKAAVGCRRLVLLTSSYPRFPGDSAGSFVAGSAEAFSRAGWQVHVLMPDHGAARPAGPQTAARRWSTPAQRGGAPAGRSPAAARGRLVVERVRYWVPASRQQLFFGSGAPENLAAHPGLALQAPAFLAALAWRARSLAQGAELVLGHWLVPGGLAAAWAARGRARSAAICHSGGLWLLERAPGGALTAGWLVERSERLLFVAEHLLERFAGLLDRSGRRQLWQKSTVLPMGVDLPEPPAAAAAADRVELRRRLGLDDRPLLLFLGRMVPIKGLDDLLRAAAGLDLQLVLAGGGPEQPALQALAVRLGLRCRFPGWISGQTKQAYLKAADALVLPSRELLGRSEGMPVAALEALTAGLPVLGTRTGGLPEVIRSGHDGLLTEAGGPLRLPELGEALGRFASSPELRARLRQGAADAGSQYTWEHLGPRLVSALT